MTNEERRIECQNKRIGEVGYNNNGDKMTIIEYTNRESIVVEFENKYRVHTQYGHFKNGGVKNLGNKLFYGRGYIDVKIYNEHNIDNTCYTYWKSMLGRCYSTKVQSVQTSYKGCTMCEEWHNFDNFYKWFKDNYYEIDGQSMQLDKDIISKGNKIYSPETSVFVPNRINSLFTKCNAVRGKYPIGVMKRGDTGRFQASCSRYNIVNNKYQQKKLGCYPTPEEAFLAYKLFKESYIKQVADEYKDKIPQKLYDAMYNWIVVITD